MPPPAERHCFLTGASAGIGAAVARLAVARGWRVTGCARRAEALERLGAELGDRFAPVVADVTDQAQLAAAAAAGAERFGPFDAVIANAGRGLDGELLDQSAADVAGVFDVNLVGVHRTVLATRPHWAGGTRLVLVSSLAAHVALPLMGAYCATKAALSAYAAALRMELHDEGVRVATVDPGTVDTGFFDAAVGRGPGWRMRPRGMPPERVARAVLRCAERGRPRRTILPWWGRPAALLARTAPGLVEWAVVRMLRRQRRAGRGAAGPGGRAS